MPEPLSMRFIRSQIRAKGYRLTKHATIARLERGIVISDIERTLLNGEIVEQYPTSEPYPSCLILGWLASGDPLHVVCSRGEQEPVLRIVTVYEPEDALWERDFKTRKVKRWMNDIVDRCDICGGPLKPGKTTLEIWRGDELLIVRDLDADVCQQCKEAYISGEVSEHLDHFLAEHHRHRPERYLAVPQYSAAQAMSA